MTNKELAKKWFSQIDGKNFTALEGLAGSGHRFHNPMTPAPAGRDEHLGLIRTMTKALQGEHILDQVIAEGEWVAVRGRWKGKHVGEFNGLAATGKPVEFPFCDFLRFEDGKLTDEHMEMNPMAIMAQIGGMQ